MGNIADDVTIIRNFSVSQSAVCGSAVCKCQMLVFEHAQETTTIQSGTWLGLLIQTATGMNVG